MKSRFIVLGSLFCLFMLFTSVSFASVSATDLQNDLLKLKNANMISDGCYQSALYATNNSIINGSSSSYSYIKYGMSVNSDYAIILRNVSDTIQLVIGFPNKSSSEHSYDYFYNPYSSGQTKNDWSGYAYYINANNINTTTNFQYTGLKDTDTFEYIYTTCGVHTRSWDLDANEEWGGNYIIDHPPTFTTTSGRGTISVYYNGNDTNFYKLPFSLSIYQIELGTIENFNTDSVYQIVGQFGAYIGQDNLNNDIVDSSSRFTFTRFGDNSYDIKNGRLKFDSNTGKVYILTNSLIYNQGYNLYFEYYKDSSTYGGDFGNTNYYTVSLNSTATSGELINPNLNTSVDIGFINSINDFYINDINELSGEVPEKLNGIFGDSGELFGLTYNSHDNWGFGDFVLSMFRNILNTLSSYQDVTINFGFLGDISSSAFTINNSAVNTFLGIFSNGFIIIIMIFFYYRFIVNVSTLDINSLFGYDIDHTFNLF